MYGRIRAVCCGSLFGEYNRIFRDLHVAFCGVSSVVQSYGEYFGGSLYGRFQDNVIDVIVRCSFLVLGDFLHSSVAALQQSQHVPRQRGCDLAQVDNVIALQQTNSGVSRFSKGNKFHRDFSTGVNRSATASAWAATATESNGLRPDKASASAALEKISVAAPVRT